MSQLRLRREHRMSDARRHKLLVEYLVRACWEKMETIPSVAECCRWGDFRKAVVNTENLDQLRVVVTRWDDLFDQI